MRTGKRKITSGRLYDQFFERASGKNKTVKKQATLEDTMKLIPWVVNRYKHQAKRIARHLKGASVRESCFNIWSFCFKHFQYEKDEQRKEQIRTPNRSWHDRHDHLGIDCDDFSTLIATCLEALQINYLFRLTKYDAPDDSDKPDEFEHIYVVAFDENGKEIIIDAVVHAFDYEVPYAEKMDEEMELQILNGVESRPITNDLPIDAQDLFINEDMELDGLDGKAEREARRAKRREKRDQRRETPLRERIRNGVTKINKFNPATVLLRTGLLASMKLNLFKVASHLRFAYWSDAEASRQGVDLAKLNQLKRIREKVEQIFYKAGGDPKNLRKAVLQGRGNRNKMVALNGLGFVGGYPTDQDSIRTILGEEVYGDEMVEPDGLNGLGEVATGAAVAAASGTMGVLAGLIKKIGNLFKRGTKAAQNFKAQDQADDAEEKTRKFSLRNMADKMRKRREERRAKRGEIPQSKAEPENQVIVFENDQEFEIPEEDFETFAEPDYNPPAAIEEDFGVMQTGEEPTANNPEGVPPDSNPVVQWVKENKGIVWTGAGLLTVGLAYMGYKAYTKRKAKKKKKKAAQPVGGIAKKRTKKTTPKKRKTARRRSTTTTARKRRVTRKQPIKRLKEIRLK